MRTLSSFLTERTLCVTLSRYAGLLAAGTLILTGCTDQQPMKSSLEERIDRFAPTVITADTAHLSAGDRVALRKIVEAAAIMDRIFIRQVWDGNEALMKQLAADSTHEGKERFRYFTINMGPWSKLDHDSAFIPGVPPRPLGANYYPADVSKEALDAWVHTLSKAEQERATGFFYVIRRNNTNTLSTVPYSVEYRDLLVPAAQLLREAASSTDNPSLRSFLTKRADALLSNDYYASDVAWMDLDSPIDVTIGPYETYMDGFFNYKAAFEAYVGLRDDEETARLGQFASRLQEIENNLPIDPKYRNPSLGKLAPIRVIDEYAIGGEARAGVQTAAFNLPNDERIVREKGSKRVMLKNVQEAKFNKILRPIAAVAIDPAQASLVAFKPFFTHILAHELMHGLGPHNIVLGGRQTTVRQELKELYSAFEEAKADISGLFALQYWIDHGVVEKTMEHPMYVTYLAGIFRSVRFGINEAHGKGMAFQFNYLADHGAIVYHEETGSYSVDFEAMKSAVKALTGEIMTLQAEGNYSRVKETFDRFATIKPQMRSVLDRLTAIPVDIAPEFPDTH